MLKRIEIKNFESHKHTVIEDISDGLNLIRGESNVGKCLTGDTIVIDKDGSWRTIKNMFSKSKWQVPSLKDNKFSFVQVSCISANGEKPVYLLKTKLGKTIKATTNHKFFTSGGWRELKDLREDDCVGVAKLIPVFGSKKLPKGHAKLLGYLNGSNDFDTSCLGIQERNIVEGFKRIIFSTEKKFNVEKFYPSPCNIKPGVLIFSIQYGLMNEVLGKKVPRAIFSSTREDIKDFIRGLFVSDGWVKKNTENIEIGFNLFSEILSQQVSHLLLRLGIVSSIRKDNSKSYVVNVCRKDFVYKLSKILGFDFNKERSELLRQASARSNNVSMDIVPKTKQTSEIVKRAIGITGYGNEKDFIVGEDYSLEKLKVLAKTSKDRELEGIVNSDLYWDKVDSIEYLGIEPTFDIEVPETHTFFANDIYTHNTSIIRALKLAAYNQFDPQSVRAGETSCEVLVETEKGMVRVKRGPKVNLWEVTPKGQATIAFEKVGRNIVPEVARVIGMNIVKLGDAEIPVNIMDQLESHFMLSSVAGQNATGSLRAQIIDEISGLSGIEGVIKSVGLDIHRFGRDIKENEIKMNDASNQLHDEQLLLQEKQLLESAEDLLKTYKTTQEKNDKAVVLENSYSKLSQDEQVLNSKLKTIPDVEGSISFLEKAKNYFDFLKLANELKDKILGSIGLINGLEEKLKNIPDVTGIINNIQLSESLTNKIKLIVEFKFGYDKLVKSIIELNNRLSEYERVGEPLEAIKTAQDALEMVKNAKTDMDRVLKLQAKLSEINDLIESNTRKLEGIEKEKEKLLEDIKVCPLTLEPVSDECLAKARQV